MAKRNEWPDNVWVKQGQIWVNSLYEVVKHDNSLVYEGDLRAKYATIFGYSTSSDAPGQIQIELVAGEHTLRAEKSKRPTIITFQLPEPHKKYFEHWVPVTELSRYTLTVVFYRHTR